MQSLQDSVYAGDANEDEMLGGGNDGGRKDYFYDDNSSQSSDAQSKITDLVEKEIDQLIRNDKRTPKILKQILWLVLFAFLTTTIISAIIMGIFVGYSQHAKSQITISTWALQRGIYTSQVMNLLRSLIDHNLGYEPDTLLLQDTQIWKGISQLQGGANFDMDAFLSKLIIDKLDIIKNRQQSLDLGGDDSTKESLNITTLNS